MWVAVNNQLKRQPYLDGSAVSDEGGRHLEPSWRDVAHGGLDVVGDPFDKVAGILVLYVQHLLVNLVRDIKDNKIKNSDSSLCQLVGSKVRCS